MTIKIICQGKRWTGFIHVSVVEQRELKVTGSRLSIRRAENSAVSEFMKDNKIGFATVKTIPQ